MITPEWPNPRLLLPEVDRIESFKCRSADQTNWLLEHAKNAHRIGTARVRVITDPSSAQDVVAYYAWCMSSVLHKHTTEDMRVGAGRYQQPVALLARLGVNQDHEGNGLGARLLHDVISRTVRIGEEIGCRGLIIHAETTEARGWYLHHIPEFQTLRSDASHLLLLTRDMAAHIG